MTAGGFPRILFVTNFCSHYRVRVFEELSRRFPVKFLFFSDGAERYWMKGLGVRSGAFEHQAATGTSVLGLRVSARLVKLVLTEPCDVIVKCINGKFALPASYLASRIRRRPFVLWTGLWTRLTTPADRVFWPITRWIYLHSDAIVAYGEHVRRFLVDVGVDDSRIFLAPNAVDNHRYGMPPAAEDVALAEREIGVDVVRAPVIVYVGRLEAEKGLSHLLRAMARVAVGDAVLALIGEGAEREALEREATELGIRDRVRFLGARAPESMPAYYAVASVFVLPSVSGPAGREPWGLVLNEAMNQRVAVVATDAVGAVAGGLVRDGETGLVVPERDERALAEALEKLLGDPSLRDRLRLAGRGAVERWTQQRMADGFAEGIRAALHARGVALPRRVL